MKSFNKALFSVLCMVFVLAASTVSAGGGCESKWSKMDLKEKFFYKAEFIMKNADDLDLSDEQIKSIKNLKMETKKMIVSKEAEAEVIWIDVMSEMYEESVNLEKVNSLIDQKYEIKKALTKGIAASYAKLKGTLSEEQMKELKELWMAQK